MGAEEEGRAAGTAGEGAAAADDKEEEAVVAALRALAAIAFAAYNIHQVLKSQFRIYLSESHKGCTLVSCSGLNGLQQYQNRQRNKEKPISSIMHAARPTPSSKDSEPDIDIHALPIIAASRRKGQQKSYTAFAADCCCQCKWHYG